MLKYLSNSLLLLSIIFWSRALLWKSLKRKQNWWISKFINVSVYERWASEIALDLLCLFFALFYYFIGSFPTPAIGNSFSRGQNMFCQFSINNTIMSFLPTLRNKNYKKRPCSVNMEVSSTKQSPRFDFFWCCGAFLWVPRMKENSLSLPLLLGTLCKPRFPESNKDHDRLFAEYELKTRRPRAPIGWWLGNCAKQNWKVEDYCTAVKMSHFLIFASDCQHVDPLKFCI